jgi:hypothetical protein
LFSIKNHLPRILGYPECDTKVMVLKISLLSGLEEHAIIPVLWRPKREDYKFETSLGYMARPYLKTTNKQKINEKTKQFLQNRPQTN